MTGVKKYDYHGEMLSKFEIAQAVGISIAALESRMYKHRLSIQEAADMGIAYSSKTQLYSYKGEMLSAPEIARRVGMSCSTLRSRLSNGMPVEEAAVPAERGRPRKPKKPPTFGMPTPEELKYMRSNSNWREGVAKKVFHTLLFHDPRIFGFNTISTHEYAAETDHIRFRITFDGNIATVVGAMKCNGNAVLKRRYLAMCSQDKISVKELAKEVLSL